jgi:hypothetical protein
MRLYYPSRVILVPNIIIISFQSYWSAYTPLYILSNYPRRVFKPARLVQYAHYWEYTRPARRRGLCSSCLVRDMLSFDPRYAHRNRGSYPCIPGRLSCCTHANRTGQHILHWPGRVQLSVFRTTYFWLGLRSTGHLRPYRSGCCVPDYNSKLVGLT